MSKNPYYMCPEYKIGASVAGLVQLDYLGIPFPTRSSFSPFSVRNVAGDKRVYGDGFPSCEWVWEPGLTRAQISNLLSFITAGDASGYVYIRTTKNTYSSFYNFYTVMIVPELEPVGYHVGAFNTVSMQFTGMVQQ